MVLRSVDQKKILPGAQRADSRASFPFSLLSSPFPINYSDSGAYLQLNRATNTEQGATLPMRARSSSRRLHSADLNFNHEDSVLYGFVGLFNWYPLEFISRSRGDLFYPCL